MITLKKVQTKQKDFVESKRKIAIKYAANLNHQNIKSVLLSGSVARKTFMPGSYGGMIDLTVIVNSKDNLDCNTIFGKDTEPDIPFHCIKYGNDAFQIKIIDQQNFEHFMDFQEPEKFAILESEVIKDSEKYFSSFQNNLEPEVKSEIEKLYNDRKGYIYYLLSDYKTERWFMRKAYLQLNQNLDIAINNYIKCLFHLNKKYVPAEDRMLYFSCNLNNLTDDFESKIEKLFIVSEISEKNYKEREEYFKKYFLDKLP